MKPMFFLFLTSACCWIATQLLVSQGPVFAGQAGSVKAMGTIPIFIEVKAPDYASNDPSVPSNDGKSVVTEVQDTVTIQNNVPVQVSLSPLVLNPPTGVASSAVGGKITLITGDDEWLMTDTSGGTSLSVDVPIGTLEAKIRFNFYSTTTAPLRPGVYTGSTVMTTIDN